MSNKAERAAVGLTGDLTKEDFEEVVGEPFESYVRPVIERYEALGPGKDRNDLFRDYFNSVAGGVGARMVGGIDTFYSDPDGLFCRLCAYEVFTSGGTLLNLVRAGQAVFTNEEYMQAYRMAESRFEQVYMLDHGCGPMHMGLYCASSLGAKVAMYDYDTPMRRVVMHGVRKYATDELNERLVFVPVAPSEPAPSFVGFKPYNFAISMDVLEHIVTPVAELQHIRNSMRHGGILLLGTFFNSCNGHDPSHLDEHEAFQDTRLWFQIVEGVGFKLVGCDPRGCEKIFERLP